MTYGEFTFESIRSTAGERCRKMDRGNFSMPSDYSARTRSPKTQLQQDVVF